MSFNVWVPQGIVVPQVSNDAPEQPTVFYEAGAQILTPNGDGKIFKMWFTTGPANAPVGINYAESNDGLTWTRYSSNPVVASQWGGRVFKNGSTYYLYSSAQVFATGINVRTSSDGITWSAPTNNIIITSVAAGFDHFAVGQLNVLAIVNGTWYGYFWGAQSNIGDGSTTNYYQGLATSSDGITWTKDPSNPVSSLNSGTFLNGQTWNGASSLGFASVNGAYYAWGQIAALSYPSATQNQPSDIMRWKATNPAGPWTPINVEVYSRNQPSETPNSFKGQVADPCLIEVNGTTFIYYTASTDGTLGSTYTVNGATAAKTLSQIVQTYEGVQNVPLSGDPALNLNMLASDNFNRADGGLGSNWTKLNDGTFVTAQIISNQVTSSVAGSSCDSFYNAIVWPNDQWAQVIITTSLAVSFVGVCLRVTAGGNAYRCYWNGTAGSSGSWFIQKKIATVFTTVATGTATFNVGDTLLGAVSGPTLTIYKNGVLLGTGTDAIISSGSPGILVVPVTATTNAFIDDWSGGAFQDAPILGNGTRVGFINALSNPLFQLNKL